MTIQAPKVLLTGDYWHADFQALIASSACVTTLIPTEKLSDEHLADPTFDLVILAASRREQFSHEWVESIRGKLSPTPIVALLGTWCEGEQRSGEPWPAVQRVYWHQWRGRFDFFLRQLESDEVCDWQLPPTANQADKLMNLSAKDTYGFSDRRLIVGVSAVSDIQYQMIADASHPFGAETYWIQRQQWDGSTDEQLSLVIVDADTWNHEVQARVLWLRNDLKIDSPIVLLLNFPRQSDLSAVHAMGITEVVSKPFQLSDLALAAERAVDSTEASFAG